MRPIVYITLIFSTLCFTVSISDAASVYMWTDKDGRMHITDEPPGKEGVVRDVIEYDPASVYQPAGPPQKSDASESESRNKEAQCRAVHEARRTLRKTQKMSAAVHQRAEEARDKVKELRRRIGYDDDRRDDFKDDLKRLKEEARRAELFAQQAEIDVQVAELQVKMAELEAGDQCAEKRRFY
jgi:hypothetical protein